MRLAPLLLVAGWVATAVASSAAIDAEAVCAQLLNQYPKHVAWDVLGPNAIETVFNARKYIEANTEYWNGVNRKNRPTCAFFPSNAEQVSVAVKLLNKYSDAQFALKSGGHNFNFGVSSTDGGVLFSFNQNLASVTRSEDGEAFHVGPGARWEDVYEEASKTNQVVVGGRLGNIGVAGFALGGGLSYYSAQYGLTCDNLIDAEVVLPNGTITHANSKTNPDLWWALKGGGNRFGIVTQFTFKAHPLGVNGQIWGGIRVYKAEDRPALFKALADFTRDYPDPKAAVIPTFNFGLPGAVISLPMVFFFYDGPVPPPDAFSYLDTIEPLHDSTGTKTYIDLTSEAGGGGINGINAAAHVNTFPNMPAEQMSELFEIHWDLYQSKTSNDSSKSLDIQMSTFALQPLSVRIANASEKAGGNALGLKPEYGDRIWVENDIIWINPMCNKACPEALHNLSDMIKDEYMAKFHSIEPTNYQSGDVDFISTNPLFMNDAADYQDVYTSYGEENKDRLRQIAEKYDPDGFMNRQGGWQLW